MVMLTRIGSSPLLREIVPLLLPLKMAVGSNWMVLPALASWSAWLMQ